MAPFRKINYASFEFEEPKQNTQFQVSQRNHEDCKARHNQLRVCLDHFAFCIFTFLEGNLQHLKY